MRSLSLLLVLLTIFVSLPSFSPSSFSVVALDSSSTGDVSTGGPNGGISSMNETSSTMTGTSSGVGGAGGSSTGMINGTISSTGIGNNNGTNNGNGNGSGNRNAAGVKYSFSWQLFSVAVAFGVSAAAGAVGML